MVGNDIIDLNETRISTNWERPGFMKKVFTPTEQAIIHASADPFMAVWQLWSMKESAYKVFMQAGGKRFYNPKKFACQLVDSTNGEVRIGDLILKTTTLFHADYLFTSAVANHSKAQSHIFQLKENNQSFQSNFMHQQVIKDFTKRNTLQSDQLTIQKDTNGVPFLQDKNGRVNTSLSITHHGNYGAYSLIVN
tara:strand:+ start:6148 stop:6726 length:579 start_codon:yes stop_codon:yes gene_type:complete